jgi:hypothetical protein
MSFFRPISTVFVYCFTVPSDFGYIQRCCNILFRHHDMKFQLQSLCKPWIPQLTEEFGQQDVCHHWCLLVRDDVSLWPLGEEVYDNQEVLTLLLALWKSLAMIMVILLNRAPAFYCCIRPLLLIQGSWLAVQMIYCLHNFSIVLSECSQ